MLNSTERDISSAHKNENAENVIVLLPNSQICIYHADKC